MRGEICVGGAAFLSFAAMLLLIFAHIGQINTSSVPRGISMARINVSEYGDALNSALFDPIDGLYTDNASEPLQVGAGLRQLYEFGFFSFCGFTNTSASSGICSNHTFGKPYRPYEYLTQDMSPNYTAITDAIVFDVSFRNSSYLGQSSVAAFWMIFLGLLTSALAFFSGFVKRNCTYLLSAVFAIISTIFILVGAAVWTTILRKSEDVNNIMIGQDSTPTLIGIEVSMGTGLYLIWAAFACSFVSLVPYMTICCTYRG